MQSSYQRMKRLYPLKPSVRRGDPQAHHLRKVPQYSGNPGWILLTHSEDGENEAMFVDKNEVPLPLHIVMDDRAFSDTVLRVLQLKPDLYVVYDVRFFNGKRVCETHTHADRMHLVDGLVHRYHYPDLTALITPDDVNPDTVLRGYEFYDEEPGTMGVFLPAEE